MALPSRHHLPALAQRERFSSGGNGPLLRILIHVRATRMWRVAVRVPTRVAPKAVDRNRVRRVLSEQVADYMGKHPKHSLDIIVSVQKNAPEVEIIKELQKHLSSLMPHP